MGGAIDSVHSIAKSHSVALSRLRLPLGNTANLLQI